MNLQKCKNGHYYDQDKFVKCPYCAVKKMPLKDTLVLDGTEDGHTKREGSSYDDGVYAEDTGTQASLKDAVAAAMKKKEYQDWETSAIIDRDTGEDGRKATLNEILGRQHFLPVGILVVIEGIQKGMIHVLESGDNYLYKKENAMFVRNEITDEIQPQASVLYDPEQNLFVLRLLDIHSDIRIGKMKLEDSVRLVPYDTILMGEDILLFVPICGDQFRWG